VIITHYYHKNDLPFQRLTTLPDDEALLLMEQLSEKSGLVYRRFKNPPNYLSDRKITEKWLYDEFIKTGGNPKLKSPYYFVVEKSLWIEEGYNGESLQIQIPVEKIDPSIISFTYSDSMVSFWLGEQLGKPFYKHDYHGKVFSLEEIKTIINVVGIPNDEWKTELSKKYDFFIEAQLWDEQPINQYMNFIK